MENKFLHKPVLLKEVLKIFDYLKNKKSTIFVDGTIGLAGHSLAISEQILNSKSQVLNKSQFLNPKLQIIGIDKDQEALKIAKSNIEKKGLADYFLFACDDFLNIKHILGNINIQKVDGVLLDLGVSSMQLDDKSRGFSFKDGEQLLDMRMDKTQHKDCEYILNNYPKHQLEKVLEAGEEKFHKKITRLVIEERKKGRIRTVASLVSIIEKAYPSKLKYRKTNFATSTFRALRLEVNDEISVLDKAIDNIVDVLNKDSKLAIITFHSLEDRIVKHKFRELENPCVCPPKQPFCTCGKKASVKVLTKKPIIPSDEGIAENPRSRSAKLRVVEKI